jgi:hypothetical protein
MQPEGVVVGGLTVALSALMIWKRTATARIIARFYRGQPDSHALLYPDAFRRWLTSEEVWRVLVIVLAAAWGTVGVWFFIVGMGWSN